MSAVILASGMTTFVQTLVKALALGSVYVIMALGFVIIFKATQVLNFAAGAISMAGAVFMTIMVADGGLPFLPVRQPAGSCCRRAAERRVVADQPVLRARTRRRRSAS